MDVVSVLTDSDNPRNYWSMLKVREKESSGVELSTNCVRLKLTAEDGKLRETYCADTEGIFRIIQSVPSKKAEPFKRWLAKVGYERIQEIEDPELAQERMKKLYELKGYSKDWIDKRIISRYVIQTGWRNNFPENIRTYLKDSKYSTSACVVNTFTALITCCS